MVIFVLTFIGGQQPARGQQYKWVDEKGVTHYSQFPPPTSPTAPPESPASTPRPTRAQTLTSSHESAIREFIHITLGSGAFDAIMNQMAIAVLPVVKAGFERDLKRSLSPEETQTVAGAFRRAFAAAFPLSLWEGEFIAIYAKHFSEADVAEMLKFYRTPVGAKAARLASVLAAEGTAVGQRLTKMKESEFGQRFQQEIAREFGQQK
jgi:hypothetical protein